MGPSLRAPRYPGDNALSGICGGDEVEPTKSRSLHAGNLFLDLLVGYIVVMVLLVLEGMARAP
jgi:hypothetical protein